MKTIQQSNPLPSKVEDLSEEQAVIAKKYFSKMIELLQRNEEIEFEEIAKNKEILQEIREHFPELFI